MSAVTRKLSLVKSEQPGKSWPSIAVGFFVAFGGVLFGYLEIYPPPRMCHKQRC